MHPIVFLLKYPTYVPWKEEWHFIHLNKPGRIFCVRFVGLVVREKCTTTAVTENGQNFQLTKNYALKPLAQVS